MKQRFIIINNNNKDEIESMNENNDDKNILIVDDDAVTSLKYKNWLEEDNIDRSFNITLINDPSKAEQIFKPENYDLVLIGFRMSVMDGFDLYNKLHILSQKVQ